MRDVGPSVVELGVCSVHEATATLVNELAPNLETVFRHADAAVAREREHETLERAARRDD